MATVIPATIVENTRADYRRTLTELFLKESNGVAGAPSKYEYQVETDNAGNTIYLKRPTNLNKGFDFEVRVSNVRFKHVSKKGRVSHSNRPSHANILEDLRAKDLNFERQLECENEIISLEWAIKDLIADRQFYFEYFGFTKDDLKGKLYEGKAKYIDLFTRVATDEEVNADLKQIEKEKDGEWGEKEQKAFEENMGMTVEQWRATVRAKF